jgi:signal transduction histidine kinase
MPIPRKKSRLQNRLWPLAILLILALTVVLMLSSARRIKDQGRQDLENALLTVLETTQGALEVWRRDLQADHQALAQLPRLRQLAEAQALHPHDARAETRFREIQEVLRPWITAHRYLSFSLYAKGPDGRIRSLFGGAGRPRIPAGSDGVIARALSGNFALGHPVATRDPDHLRSGHRRGVVIVAAAPIQHASGEAFAALTITLDAFDAITQVTRLGRMGASGETYAVDAAGRMVTGSRFESQPEGGPSPDLKELRDPGDGPGSAHPFTRMAQSLMRGESGVDLDGYRDYRGRFVVGAWAWNPDLGFGLATEIDRAEAYRSNEMIQDLVWTMIGILIVGMSIILLFREARSRNLNRILALQQSDQARKDLLAVVSHDLKNPLSALLMTNEILLKTLPPDLGSNEQRRSLLEKSRRAAEQMRRLITDLLDSARIEAGKLEIHPAECAATQLIDQTMDVLEPIAAQKGLRLTRAVPGDLPLLWADSERISQILSNLLGNAIKFTEKGGEVAVRASGREDCVEFAVSDTGAGIAREDLPHLFERYWQAKQAQGLGTGLGLAICKELVTAHGGRIWVESEEGRGSVFRFTLPTLHAAGARGLRRSAPTGDPERRASHPDR